MPTWIFSTVDGKSAGTEGALTDFSYLSVDSISATKINFLGKMTTGILTGTGFTKSGVDVVTGGTVTGLTLKFDGTTVLKATGLDVSVMDLASYFETGNSYPMAMALFSGRDMIFGSEGGEDIYGFGRSDTVHAGVGRDEIYGGNGADSLMGGMGHDSIRGDSGNDTLRGNRGNDILDGGDGDDVVYCGLGNDTVLGGDGADQFVFVRALGNANADTIIGFESGADQIVLDNDIFTAIGPVGTLAGSRFVLGTAAADANDRIIFDSGSGAIWYDRDGSGAAAKQLIATLGFDVMAKVAFVLTAADIQIID